MCLRDSNTNYTNANAAQAQHKATEHFKHFDQDKKGLTMAQSLRPLSNTSNEQNETLPSPTQTTVNTQQQDKG